jgi:hypothetical protein
MKPESAPLRIKAGVSFSETHLPQCDTVARGQQEQTETEELPAGNLAPSLKITVPPLLGLKFLTIRYMAVRHGGTLALQEVKGIDAEESGLPKGWYWAA